MQFSTGKAERTDKWGACIPIAFVIYSVKFTVSKGQQVLLG